MKPGEVTDRITTRDGRTITVRAVAETDTDALLRYANTLVEEDTFIMLSGAPLTREYEAQYVRDSVAKLATGDKIHLLALDGDVIAASFEIRRFGFRKRHVGEIGISVLKPYRDAGLGSACMDILIREAKKVGLKLLLLSVFETNPAAIHVYEKKGFRKAGLVPGVFRYKDAFVGDVSMFLPL